VIIRRILEQDWAVARALRLRSLACDPDAFAATLDEERALGDAAWQARTRSNAEGSATVGFFAVVDGAEVGMVVGVRNTLGIELNTLWVAPEARGRGAACALVEAVASWAAQAGAARLELEVTECSTAARRLYEKLGFAAMSGERACGSRQAPALRMRREL
jgi:ribosomal protein S18 acetylase RimI-like enzyme